MKLYQILSVLPKHTIVYLNTNNSIHVSTVADIRELHDSPLIKYYTRDISKIRSRNIDVIEIFLKEEQNNNVTANGKRLKVRRK